jgi:hypothetical protein
LRTTEVEGLVFLSEFVEHEAQWLDTRTIQQHQLPPKSRLDRTTAGPVAIHFLVVAVIVIVFVVVVMVTVVVLSLFSTNSLSQSSSLQ